MQKKDLNINGSYMIILEISKCHVKYYLNLEYKEREKSRQTS